jgi:SAM-dependent methyltransferase
MPEGNYIGSELEIFKHAVNWKRYYGSLIRPFLGKKVLEVGAGIGATTEVLVSGEQTRWVCLEPDSVLVDEIIKKVDDGRLPPICEPRVGDISCLGADDQFDSVIYIDVLEHIEKDAEEVANAAEHVKTGGHLIVLSPAHQFLYTPFDEAIGHFRRYSRASLEGVAARTGLSAVRSMYLDSVGTAASLANKLLLRSAMPSKTQIVFWDRFLVRASRIVDPILLRRVGKSILSIWRKERPARSV